MTNERNSWLVTELRKIGTRKCLERADWLQAESSSTGFLNLRDLRLTASNVASIARCLKQEAQDGHLTESISFSYNPLMGDPGAIALSKKLPRHIATLGLVDCGITDLGGMEILNWMKNSPNLQMICIEQNNFSARLELAFAAFKSTHPEIVVDF